MSTSTLSQLKNKVRAMFKPNNTNNIPSSSDGAMEPDGRIPTISSIPNIIYMSGRPIHTLGCGTRRPSPDTQHDPFRHAILNRWNNGGEVVKYYTSKSLSGVPRSIKDGLCQIADCEYCALCAGYAIDPFQEQQRRVSRDDTCRWDAYDHWVKNEQIPRFRQSGFGGGSKKAGACWIKDCEYCHFNQPQWDPDVAAGLRLDYNGTAVKGVSETLKYPFDMCPVFNTNPKLGCGECREISLFMSDTIKLDSVRSQWLPGDLDHNKAILRNLAFHLSPLAVDNSHPDEQPTRLNDNLQPHVRSRHKISKDADRNKEFNERFKIKDDECLALNTEQEEEMINHSGDGKAKDFHCHFPSDEDLPHRTPSPSESDRPTCQRSSGHSSLSFSSALAKKSRAPSPCPGLCEVKKLPRKTRSSPMLDRLGCEIHERRGRRMIDTACSSCHSPPQLTQAPSSCSEQIEVEVQKHHSALDEELPRKTPMPSDLPAWPHHEGDNIPTMQHTTSSSISPARRPERHRPTPGA